MASDQDKALSSELKEKILSRFPSDRTGLTPPLPEKISVEVNNSCNHRCFFCQNPLMQRKRRVMDDDMLFSILTQAYEAGIRTCSLYSGGEPFLNRRMADYVGFAKKLGFEYVYLSSNGGKAATSRIIPVLEAGLDSIKFSVNGGTRENYATVHGFDEFDDVVSNIERVLAWRQENRPAMKVFVSYVDTGVYPGDFDRLVERFGSRVDDVIRYPFAVVGTPLTRRDPDDTRPQIGYEAVNAEDDINKLRSGLPCYQLWSYLNVTVEGYLSACCSDYNNDLVVGNLHQSKLLDAWHSPEFQQLRQEHLDGRIENTLCDGCIRRCDRPYVSLNAHLKTNETGKAEADQ